MDLPFDAGDPTLAAAAWSRLAEPGDEAAGALVAALGPGEALERLRRGGDFPVSAPGERVLWDRARDRWLPRLAGLDPRRELETLARVGGRLVLPGAEEWPAGLDDLGPARPFCLWVRGRPLRPALEGAVAVVGSRASTAYGDHVAADLAAQLAERGFAVLSGGAYGIDAAAHRGALAARGTTVAVLAGGVDRFYPPGNADLLGEIEAAGAVLAESPPGSAPFRARFLQRNRLIAAAALGTVVVEAAWRSGALSTAAHAARLLRPVGAVPGPVTSTASAGCHRLIRDAGAVLVTDAAEVIELVGPLRVSADPGEGPRDGERGTGRGAPPEGLEPRESRTFEAVPLVAAASADSIARTAGLGPGEVRVALAFLELAGLVERSGDRWRRPRPGRRP